MLLYVKYGNVGLIPLHKLIIKHANSKCYLYQMPDSTLRMYLLKFLVIIIIIILRISKLVEYFLV